MQHLSRIKRDPTTPNLRQVHLIHLELFDELKAKGFSVQPGQLGENISTQGVDLLGLPRGTLLHIGDTVLAVTGLRNPCKQIEAFEPGLLSAMLDKVDGKIIRKAGIMSVVVTGGTISAGDAIRITLPTQPHEELDVV